MAGVMLRFEAIDLLRLELGLALLFSLPLCMPDRMPRRLLSPQLVRGTSERDGLRYRDISRRIRYERGMPPRRLTRLLFVLPNFGIVVLSLFLVWRTRGDWPTETWVL